jgi:hypothetical protein
MLLDGPRLRASSRMVSRSRCSLTLPSQAESTGPCHHFWNTF